MAVLPACSGLLPEYLKLRGVDHGVQPGIKEPTYLDDISWAERVHSAIGGGADELGTREDFHGNAPGSWNVDKDGAGTGIAAHHDADLIDRLAQVQVLKPAAEIDQRTVRSGNRIRANSVPSAEITK